MNAAGQASFWRRWPEGLRWAACFTLVLGAHAAAAAVLLGHWHGQEEPIADAPVILVELAPVAVAPAVPATDVAPGPLQTQSASATEPEKPAVTADITSALKQPVEKVETIPLPPLPQAAPPDVVPPPRKPPEKAETHKPHHRQANLASAPSATERNAARAAAPAPGAASHDPNALPNWKSSLVARLERYKRYPSEAQARGEQGVAQLAFSVDRSGGVHNARILRSSGSDVLDRATLALVTRAQPLPPPPPEIRGAQIAIVVPIRYNMR